LISLPIESKKRKTYIGMRSRSIKHDTYSESLRYYATVRGMSIFLMVMNKDYEFFCQYGALHM
jgi:hypothetical protein